MNFRERYQWTIQYIWPATAIEMMWSLFSSLVYAESWYNGAEAFHIVAAFFVIAPWTCRRALGLTYPTFRILTYGYGSKTPRAIRFLEAFKVAWLLGWRSGVLSIGLLLATSLVFTQAKTLFGMAFGDRMSGGGASPWNALILTGLDVVSNMALIPLLIPSMLKKKYHGFHIERVDNQPIVAKTESRPVSNKKK